MSNSARAKERRHRRSKLNKHERGVMEKQHSGDQFGRSQPLKADRDESLAKRLGFVHVD